VSSDDGATYRDLQRLAKSRRINTQQVLELYAHERMIARIGESRWRSRLVLKGGMLLATLHLRDVTRDLDLLGLGIDTSDLDAVRTLMAELVLLDLDDGIAYDPSNITIAQIRDDADYPGLRVRLLAHIHTARVRVQIDLSIGDPVAGVQHRFDPMLAGAPIDVIAYPIEAVLAEKIATMMTLGDANTRERDYADVWLIGHAMNIDAHAFRAQLAATAASRGHTVSVLTPAIVGMGEIRQASWERFRARTGLTHLPDEFAMVVEFVGSFVDVAISSSQTSTIWDSTTQQWQ
jgi:hypothetical protein